MAADINVLVYPNWGTGSVYVNRLNETVQASGVKTEFTSYHGALFPLSRQYDRHKYDLLHLHWVSELFAAEERSFPKFLIRYVIALSDIWFLRNVRKAKIVWTIHNHYAHDALRPKWDRIARKFLAKRCDQLIVHGPSGVKLLEDTWGIKKDKCTCLPHGNHRGAFPNETNKTEARRKLNIGEDKKVILFFGSLRKYKGVDELISAFSQIDREDTILMVAGRIKDKAYKQQLQQQGGDKVRFADEFIPNEEAQYYMHASDVVALPFRRIMTSGSMLLAMTFGRIIVAPKMGTLPDYLSKEGGVLYEGDGLKEAILRALLLDQKVASEANIKMVDKLEWEPIGAATSELFRYVLGIRDEKPDVSRWW